MQLLRHCCLQEYLSEDGSSDLDWDYIIEQSAAAGTDGDLLQLALNCTNHTVASGATASICLKDLEAHVACRLMLTAAVRRHAAALHRLASLQVFSRHLDAPTLEKLLHLLMLRLPPSNVRKGQLDASALQEVAHFDRHARQCWSGSAALLCRMPAAAQLSSEQVATLLHKAVHSDDFRSVQPLLSLPAAEHLCSMCMEQLLRSALVSGRQRSCCVQMLCSTPAARALGCDAVARLLQAAAQLGEGDWMGPGFFATASYRSLCSLPGAEQLTSSMIAAAMKAAAEKDRIDSLRLLCELPAAEQLTSADVQVMLHAAVERNCIDSVMSMAQLPGAQQLTSADVQVMLHAAVERNYSDSVMILAQLPAAQQLTSAQANLLLQVAMKQRFSSCMQHLCQLPGARMLSKWDVESLLETAGESLSTAQECCSCFAVWHLIQLPAGSELGLSEAD
jgi:hypothetical protein